MCPTTTQPDSRTPALTPPRFTLRTLLLAMTALCCLFAAMAAVGMLWSLAIALILCLVGAHVLGNSLGTRLRDDATRCAQAERPARVIPPNVPTVVAPPRLAERTKVHRMIPLASIAGAGAGGDLGGALAAYSYPEASTAAIALGVVSLAVLGGLLGFATASFLTVFRQAMRQALAAEKRGQNDLIGPSRDRDDTSRVGGRNKSF